MKTIFNKYDKHAINDLPRALFQGRIITINTEGETRKAVDYLLDSDILGVSVLRGDEFLNLLPMV